jgi:hypothetical protein
MRKAFVTATLLLAAITQLAAQSKPDSSKVGEYHLMPAGKGSVGWQQTGGDSGFINNPQFSNPFN